MELLLPRLSQKEKSKSGATETGCGCPANQECVCLIFDLEIISLHSQSLIQYGEQDSIQCLAKK